MSEEESKTTKAVFRNSMVPLLDELMANNVMVSLRH